MGDLANKNNNTSVRVVLVEDEVQAGDAYALTLKMIAEREYTARPGREEFVAGVLKYRDRLAFLVAYDGERAVGMARFAEYFHGYEAGMVGYYQGLYVVDEMRGRGVAEALFNALRAEAKRRKVKALGWLVEDTNAASNGFFVKHVPGALKKGLYREYWMEAAEL